MFLLTAFYFFSKTAISLIVVVTVTVVFIFLDFCIALLYSFLFSMGLDIIVIVFDDALVYACPNDLKKLDDFDRGVGSGRRIP